MVNRSLSRDFNGLEEHDEKQQLNSSVPKEIDVISVLLVSISAVVSDMTRGITVPTLWLFLYSMGGKGTDLGVATAAFSVGRIISTPLAGIFSEIIGYKLPLFVCSVLLVVGSVLYCSATSIAQVVVAQLVTGIGAGTLGVSRSYLAEQTSLSYRSTALSYLTAAQFTGFALAPIIGALLASFGKKYPIHLFSSRLILNEYTLPSVIVMLLGILQGVALLTLFQEIPRDQTQPLFRIELIDVMSLRPVKAQPSVNSSLAVSLDSGNLRTVYAATQNDISDDRTTSDFPKQAAFEADSRRRSATESTPLVPFSRDGNINALPRRSKSSISVGSYSTSTIRRRNWFTFRLFLITFGCVLNLVLKGSVGVYETIGAEFVGSHFHWDYWKAGYTFSFFGVCGVITLVALLPFLFTYFSDLQLLFFGLILMTVACLLVYLTFDASEKIYEGQFYLSVAMMYVVGFPMGNAALLGAVSKLAPRGPQGGIMGWLSSMGALGRVIFPLMAGIVTEYYGDETSFGVTAIFLFVSTVAVGIGLRWTS